MGIAVPDVTRARIIISIWLQRGHYRLTAAARVAGGVVGGALTLSYHGNRAEETQEKDCLLFR